MRLSTLATLATAARFTVATTGYSNSTTIITPPPSPPVTACPTITSTTNLCRTCGVPDCIVLSTLTQHCNCPKDPVTAFTSHPCELQCGIIGCATQYTIVTATGCSTSKSSSKTSSHSSKLSSYSHSKPSSSPKPPPHTYSQTKPDDDYCATETDEHPPHTTKKPPHGIASPPGKTWTYTDDDHPPLTTVGPTKAPTAKPSPPKSTLMTSGGRRRAVLPFRGWW